MQNSNNLVESFEYPRYLERFATLFANLEDNTLQESKDILAKATWHFVVFTHAVMNKSFAEALTYLQKANEAFSQYHHDSSSHAPHLLKLQQFIENLQKQYQEFLLRKNKLI
ncbi:MAG: hypothetical protein JSS07_06400 [Proteobacteria bacterium]|nr:hypothetical protein [Pseudomonadota bacterium]